MELPKHIEVRLDVMMGKPDFTGTRTPAYSQKLAAGETSDQILEAHPQRQAEHLMAALEYAAQLAAVEDGPDTLTMAPGDTAKSAFSTATPASHKTPRQ